MTPSAIRCSVLLTFLPVALVTASWAQAPATQATPDAPAAGSPASPPPEATQPAFYSLHEQATWIDQGHPTFPSAYEGLNSLTSAAEDQRTFSFSLFLGIRVWSGTEIYYNPEVFQGHG